MVRRAVSVVAGSAAVALGLSGCLFAYDVAKPTMHYVNESSQTVVVVVEGLGDEYPDAVPSNDYYTYYLHVCQGTGIRVETEGGEFLGRVNEPGCPNWTLTINADGSLDYVED